MVSMASSASSCAALFLRGLTTTTRRHCVRYDLRPSRSGTTQGLSAIMTMLGGIGTGGVEV
jgi:hypothetical protein